MGVLRPDLIIKNVVPVIMAGIIGIYGLVVAVLVSDGCISPQIRVCTLSLQVLFPCTSRVGLSSPRRFTFSMLNE